MSSPAEAAVTWPQALAWRMRRQLLDPLSTGSAADVVRRLGAVLSTDQAAAELAVRTRLATSAASDLADALANGDVIEVFAYRGARHYLSADEGGIYLTLRTAGRQWELASWVEHYRLAAADWPDFRAAVREALTDRPLTAAELGDALGRTTAYRHLEPIFHEGASTLIKALNWQGDVSFGPRRDGQPTLQRLDSNPAWRPVADLDEAGTRAITAYLSTYGPATPDHLHYWFGEGLSAGRKRLTTWFSQLGDRLAAIDVDGTAAYVLRDDVDDLQSTVPTDAVRLLPGHDQWVIGPGTKDVNVTPAALRDLITRKANPVVVGGIVRGTWTRIGDQATVQWLDEQSRPDAAIAQEVARLADIVGHDLRMAYAL